MHRLVHTRACPRLIVVPIDVEHRIRMRRILLAHFATIDLPETHRLIERRSEDHRPHRVPLERAHLTLMHRQDEVQVPRGGPDPHDAVLGPGREQRTGRVPRDTGDVAPALGRLVLADNVLRHGRRRRLRLEVGRREGWDVPDSAGRVATTGCEERRDLRIERARLHLL